MLWIFPGTNFGPIENGLGKKVIPNASIFYTENVLFYKLFNDAK